MTNTHTELCRQILITHGNSPNWRIWLNNTGATKTASGGFIKFGLPGSSDIIGFDISGRFIAIECKTGTGVLRMNQINFKKLCIGFNCHYLEARSIEDANQFFAKLQNQLHKNILPDF